MKKFFSFIFIEVVKMVLMSVLFIVIMTLFSQKKMPTTPQEAVKVAGDVMSNVTTGHIPLGDMASAGAGDLNPMELQKTLSQLQNNRDAYYKNIESLNETGDFAAPADSANMPSTNTETANTDQIQVAANNQNREPQQANASTMITVEECQQLSQQAQLNNKRYVAPAPNTP